MGLYINGKEIADKDIVNVDGPLTGSTRKSASWEDMTGLPENKNVLKAINYTPTVADSDNVISNSTLLCFGVGNKKGYLNIAWNKNNVKVGGGIDDPTISQIKWHENVAWKSDISKLEQRIQQLESKIGGVLRSIKNFMCSAFSYRKAVA